jgi:2,4-dihydroxyhept-2-ene-1,7-dioic acid aldolase
MDRAARLCSYRPAPKTLFRRHFMRLVERLADTTPIMSAWSGIPSPELIAHLSRSAFDAVTIDMQHGMHTESTALRAVISIVQAGKPAILRIPVGRNDLASRALDAGFEAVIAPMINSLEDARAFAAAMKYPPVGERSWGPAQALQLHPEFDMAGYFAAANSKTLAIAMIETRAALAALDDILALDGIDAVFVGPSDLSISWSGGAGVDPDRGDMQEVIAEVATRASAAGKFAAIYCGNPARARDYARLGYRMMALGSDGLVINAGAEAVLSKARG